MSLARSIWAPESARKGTGGSKPILLWVYGGSHNTGTGESSAPDPTEVAVLHAGLGAAWRDR